MVLVNLVMKTVLVPTALGHALLEGFYFVGF